MMDDGRQPFARATAGRSERTILMADIVIFSGMDADGAFRRAQDLVDFLRCPGSASDCVVLPFRLVRGRARSGGGEI